MNADTPNIGNTGNTGNSEKSESTPFNAGAFRLCARCGDIIGPFDNSMFVPGTYGTPYPKIGIPPIPIVHADTRICLSVELIGEVKKQTEYMGLLVNTLVTFGAQFARIFKWMEENQERMDARRRQ